MTDIQGRPFMGQKPVLVDLAQLRELVSGLKLPGAKRNACIQAR